jgi:signal transduction histidine kinase
MLDRPPAVGTRPPWGELAALLAHRQPADLASEALSLLMAEFGATAASLWYAARPPVGVRQGELSELLTAHLNQWEATVQQRVAAGSWEMDGKEVPSLARQSVAGTGQMAVHSLILDGNRVAGTLGLIYPQDRLPTGGERASLLRFLGLVGQALSLVSDLALTKQRMSQLSLFYQVAQAMASTFDLDRALDDTLELTTAILDANASALIMIDQEGGGLVFEHAHGDGGELRRGQRAALGEGIAGWVAAHGEPAMVNDVQRDPRFNPKVDTWPGSTVRSVVCVPIRIRGRTVGVLEALNKRRESGFDAEDLSLLITTASQAAIAIENNQLYQSLRDEQERIIRAQENVRRQVARNLHDGTVQFLSAISMGIDHLERLLDLRPEEVQDELEDLRNLTYQATQQARLAIFELRPLILETQGLLPALEAYVQQLRDSETFNVHLEAVKPIPQMNSSVAAIVFAIIQEAVNNAKKHAAPEDVWLHLARDGDWLEVRVRDNGTGFDFEAVEQDYDQRGSIGLLNMRERAELIDGHVEIQSAITPPDAGTWVILRVPLPPEGEPAATEEAD